jgi:hypothetical protein
MQGVDRNMRERSSVGDSHLVVQKYRKWESTVNVVVCSFLPVGTKYMRSNISHTHMGMEPGETDTC